MNFGGIEEISLVDYPKKVASVIFFRGCRMGCPQCHNKELLVGINEVEIYDIYVPWGMIDAIVLSGGEPTEQPHACKEWIVLAHQHNKKIAIQTSGCNPRMMDCMQPDLWIVDTKQNLNYDHKVFKGKNVIFTCATDSAKPGFKYERIYTRRN
jgi:pyruvate-formate lyase-activating enzyme